MQIYLLRISVSVLLKVEDNNMMNRLLSLLNSTASKCTASPFYQVHLPSRLLSKCILTAAVHNLSTTPVKRNHRRTRADNALHRTNNDTVVTAVCSAGMCVSGSGALLGFFVCFFVFFYTIYDWLLQNTQNTNPENDWELWVQSSANSAEGTQQKRTKE